ncbi:hypothetical protein [Psychrobacter sp. FDAARGOS_221]|uniref:hypothetical protein n=1 Tax=Psychrobacter sp. FDAARGOS_221 TaxID=1975705 RepID=UPI000BB53118|nr:hypothetical protein [Psychrobacter sp. FDAARGOS_221]PNK59917.1 hypothetical protein A6J60_002830 [Psychrobacter sp. FDAARGOS_221]
MACQRQAYQDYLAEQQALDDAFAEFGVATEQSEFEFEVMTIWREFEPILPLFDYIVLQRNSFNGYVMGVDWIAVDILLRREDVTVTPEDFANFRSATDGYVNSINEYLSNSSSS